MVLPEDKFDVDAVKRLDKELPENVIPLLPELMEWLQDMNWPVAKAVLPLLIRYEDITTQIAMDILKQDQKDDIWKYQIIKDFVPAVSDSNQNILFDSISRIAYHPTKGEKTEEVDEAAREYLLQLKRSQR